MGKGLIGKVSQDGANCEKLLQADRDVFVSLRSTALVSGGQSGLRRPALTSPSLPLKQVCALTSAPPGTTLRLLN